MKNISEIMEESTKSMLSKIEKGTEKIVNSRQLIIKDFTDKINSERKGTKYKPLSPKVVAIK